MTIDEMVDMLQTARKVFGNLEVEVRNEEGEYDTARACAKNQLLPKTRKEATLQLDTWEE